MSARPPRTPSRYQRWGEIPRDYRSQKADGARTCLDLCGLEGATILVPWKGPEHYGPDAHGALAAGLDAVRDYFEALDGERGRRAAGQTPDGSLSRAALERLVGWHNATRGDWPR